MLVRWITCKNYRTIFSPLACWSGQVLRCSNDTPSTIFFAWFWDMIGNPSVLKGHEKQRVHLGLWCGNEPFRGQFFSKTYPRPNNPFETILQLTLSFVCPFVFATVSWRCQDFFCLVLEYDRKSKRLERAWTLRGSSRGTKLITALASSRAVTCLQSKLHV